MPFYFKGSKSLFWCCLYCKDSNLFNGFVGISPLANQCNSLFYQTIYSRTHLKILYTKNSLGFTVALGPNLQLRRFSLFSMSSSQMMRFASGMRECTKRRILEPCVRTIHSTLNLIVLINTNPQLIIQTR